MTLNNFTSVLCNGNLDLSYDSFIQVIDWETVAHYRMTPNGLALGGDPCPFSFYDLLNAEVISIDFQGNFVEVAVR